MIAWLKPRRYRHFDAPVNEAWARKAMDPALVSRHIFLPLIHYTKAETRYKKCATTGERTIVTKLRPIKYASHRDSCIMACYADQLNQALDTYYSAAGISESVVA